MDNPSPPPNVVFVITDDQGYGDLACHGNPIIQTPHLDQLHSESVRLTNFHVGPTCSPTRAGLMTGRYCNCTGVWHTIAGRSLLRRDEVTLADFFRAGGYRTGMFGKWHLGDNYPFRPHDRGFDEALYHGDGAIGSTPDYWGNDYFDDTYYRQDTPEAFEGYCTDVWFDEAMRFIERNRDRPFFCYLSTNAPHGPYRVAEHYSAPYKTTEPEQRANFYGMITCIDDNMARLRQKLRDLQLEENTILIFMTDNGTAIGCELDADSFVVDGYNAGMRGRKNSEYDGGHRVPFFLYWPAGGFSRGRDIPQLTANIDILPTLTDLCGIPGPDPADIHGTSLVPLLHGQSDTWPDRVIVTDSQRVEHPVKWRKSATMTQRWRLVNGLELYDILEDPGQRHDLALEHPEIVRQLRRHYEKWWDLVSERFDEEIPIVIGSAHEPLTRLTTHDWHNEQSLVAWNQGQIRAGLVCNGHWAIDVAHDGLYTFELRRWPREEDLPLTAGIPGPIDWYNGGRAIPIRHARIAIGGQKAERTVHPDDKCVTFTLPLSSGETRLQTWLTDEAGQAIGAYFVYVQRSADTNDPN